MPSKGRNFDTEARTSEDEDDEAMVVTRKDIETMRFTLREHEWRKVKAVCERLTNEDLLKNCLCGKTQNLNVFTQQSGDCAPKSSVRKSTLDFTITQATINFDIGQKEGFLGNELGITNHRILKLPQEMDKEKK